MRTYVPFGRHGPAFSAVAGDEEGGVVVLQRVINDPRPLGPLGEPLHLRQPDDTLGNELGLQLLLGLDGLLGLWSMLGGGEMRTTGLEKPPETLSFANC